MMASNWQSRNLRSSTPLIRGGFHKQKKKEKGWSGKSKIGENKCGTLTKKKPQSPTFSTKADIHTKGEVQLRFTNAEYRMTFRIPLKVLDLLRAYKLFRLKCEIYRQDEPQFFLLLHKKIVSVFFQFLWSLTFGIRQKATASHLLSKEACSFSSLHVEQKSIGFVTRHKFKRIDPNQ